MSMTREEAKGILENWKLCHYTPSREAAEAVISALDPLEIISALRPVSRERVEKVWSGCDFCNTADFGEFGFEITKHYAKICCALGSWRFPEKEQFLFCPKCGKPLTDEAVEMVMERMEGLRNESC